MFVLCSCHYLFTCLAQRSSLAALQPVVSQLGCVKQQSHWIFTLQLELLCQGGANLGVRKTRLCSVQGIQSAFQCLLHFSCLFVWNTDLSLFIYVYVNSNKRIAVNKICWEGKDLAQSTVLPDTNLKDPVNAPSTVCVFLMLKFEKPSAFLMKERQRPQISKTFQLAVMIIKQQPTF